MKKENYKISCFQGMIKDQYLYFVPDNANAVCKLDLITYNVENITWLDENGADTGGKYYSLLLIEDKVVLIPGGAENILVYDLGNKSKTSVKIDCDIEMPDVSKKAKYFCGFSYGRKIFILGYKYPVILCFNMPDESPCTTINGKILYSFNDIHKENIFGFSGGFCRKDDKNYYIAMADERAVLKINAQEEEVERIAFADEASIIYGVVKQKDTMWIFVNQNKESVLVEWNNQKTTKRRITVDKQYGEEIWWWNPIAIEDKLFFFSMNKPIAYVVDTEEGNTRIIQSVKDSIGKIPNIYGKCLIRVIGEYQGKILFITIWNKKWYEYDLNKDVVKDIYIGISDNEYEKRIINSVRYRLNDSKIITENVDEFKAFLKMVDSNLYDVKL